MNLADETFPYIADMITIKTMNRKLMEKFMDAANSCTLADWAGRKWSVREMSSATVRLYGGANYLIEIVAAVPEVDGEEIVQRLRLVPLQLARDHLVMCQRRLTESRIEAGRLTGLDQASAIMDMYQIRAEFLCALDFVWEAQGKKNLTPLKGTADVDA